MLCYTCTTRGIERPAVATCRSCSAGLCLEHLRETAAQLAPNPLASCHHDTWRAQVTRQWRFAHESSGDFAPRAKSPQPRSGSGCCAARGSNSNIAAAQSEPAGGDRGCDNPLCA